MTGLLKVLSIMTMGVGLLKGSLFMIAIGAAMYLWHYTSLKMYDEVMDTQQLGNHTPTPMRIVNIEAKRLR